MDYEEAINIYKEYVSNLSKKSLKEELSNKKSMLAKLYEEKKKPKYYKYSTYRIHVDNNTNYVEDMIEILEESINR